MQKDFYLHEQALASYFEKDWIDHILSSNAGQPLFEFAPFAQKWLYSSYHEQLIQFLAAILAKEELEPKKMLEVGSSLGRTFFEVCQQIKSLEAATLIEPSHNLHSLFERIFSRDGVESVSSPILRGMQKLADASLNPQPIREACAKVRVSSLNTSFQEAPKDLGLFDLVICSNVIDQCKDHLQLNEFLKESTGVGGILLLSCTYQWQEKYIGNAPLIEIKNINQLFNSEWKLMGETNLPFQVRINERYWMTFLSHVVVYQRLN